MLVILAFHKKKTRANFLFDVSSTFRKKVSMGITKSTKLHGTRNKQLEEHF